LTLGGMNRSIAPRWDTLTSLTDFADTA
jgi:hypothetical protein